MLRTCCSLQAELHFSYLVAKPMPALVERLQASHLGLNFAVKHDCMV